MVSREFFWRRMHSLLGLWLVLFLVEHMLTNSQAALWLGQDGSGFVRSVNFIHGLPYLHFIEVGLLLIPFLIHGLWGFKYAREGKTNQGKGDGTKPSIRTGRNRAFTWQRLTSWFLAVMVIFHVANMRFIHYPEKTDLGSEKGYVIVVSDGESMNQLASEYGVKITERKEGKVVAVAPDFGTATLFVVRDTFKSPMMVILYSLFVLAAAFHAGNGLWTAWITWGFNVSRSAQKRFLKVSWGLTALLSIWGLGAIWLSS